MMTAASVIRACDLPTTDSGSFTTPATSRNAPPPGNISAYDGQHLPSHVPDFDKPSPPPLTSKPSNGTDSGYASFAPTPDKGTLAQKLFKRTPKKLSIFEQDVPDPVRNRFHDLYVLFNEPLYRYLGKHGFNFTAISIKLKYAGESEATANPWIIVQCDERASKRVRRFFNQQQIKAQYQPRDAQFPGVTFGLLVHGTPPKQMATNSEHYICGDMWDGAPTLCGKPIKICTSNETRLATLGGLIKVVSQEGIQLYGMTAGHIITRQKFAQDAVDDDEHTYGKRSTEDKFSAVNNTSVAGATEDGRTNEASMTDDQSSDGENDHEEGSEQGEDEEEYELDFGAVDDQQEKSSIDPAALSQCLRRSDLLQFRWPKLGHLSSVSHQPASKHDLDWALIKFQDPSLYRPNLLVFPESTYEFGVSARLIEGPRRLTRATRSRDVLLLSGMAGLKRGKLATSFGYLMMGPVEQFNEVYNVSMSDGSVIDAGDCGSWVVDSVTHEVYGHVVASDAFGDAYVIPLDNTFRDIRQQLAADQVCLPTEREVLEWIEQRNSIQTCKETSIMDLCTDFTPPDLPVNLRFKVEQEMASPAPESEDYDKQLMVTDSGLPKSYGLMDGHRTPLSSTLYGDRGGRPASHLMSTSIPDIPSAADMRLVEAFPDSGYSSRRSSPLGHSQGSGAMSSTVSATRSTYCRNSRLAERSSTHMQSNAVLSPSSADAIDSQKYSSTLISSSSSAASSTADYLCLHRFCEYRSKRASDLERHMTMHFPPASSKNSDGPAFGCGRSGNFEFRREDKMSENIKHVHHNNVPRRESAAMLSKKKRASPAEEDTPRKRTKCDRGVMAPAISEVGHNQPQSVWPNITQSQFFEQHTKQSDFETDSGYGSRTSSMESSPGSPEDIYLSWDITFDSQRVCPPGFQL